MFNNLINRHDLLKIIEIVKEGKIFPHVGKIFHKSRQRIEESWKHKESPPINWWDIPQVNKRINKLISGSEEIDLYSYVEGKYFQGKRDMLALSLGCGSGVHEIQWAKTGLFKRINAYDLSQKRIEHAILVASEQNIGELIHFLTDNVLEMDLGYNLYDFVILQGSLHHFSPLEEILNRVNKCLTPAGYVIVKDFVGPSRLQWTDRQLQVVNGIIKLLPYEYKKKWDSQRLKTHVYKPSRLRMILNDPSEAVESEKILPLLNNIFKEVEKRELGGTILQLLFHEIAFHFIPDDSKTKKILQLCFDIEDILLDLQEIPSDFIFGIYQKR